MRWNIDSSAGQSGTGARPAGGTRRKKALALTVASAAVVGVVVVASAFANRRVQAAGDAERALPQHVVKAADLSPEVRAYFERLSREEIEAVQLTSFPPERDFFIRFFGSKDRLTGEPDELRFMVSALERAPMPESGHEPVSRGGYHDVEGMVTFALNGLARAWAQVGPIEALRGDVIEQATRYSGHPDPLVRTQAALVLWVVKNKPEGGKLPEHAEKTYAKLMQDSFVSHELESVYKAQMEEAVGAAGGPR